MTAPETTAPAPAEPEPAGDDWPEITQRYARMAAEWEAEVADWYASARARVRARPRRDRRHAVAPAALTLPDLPEPELAWNEPARAPERLPEPEQPQNHRTGRRHHGRHRWHGDGPGPASQEQAAEASAQGWARAGRDADFSPPPTPGPSRDHAGIWLPPEQVRPGGPMSRPLPADLDEAEERRMGRFFDAHDAFDAVRPPPVHDGNTAVMERPATD